MVKKVNKSKVIYSLILMVIFLVGIFGLNLFLEHKKKEDFYSKYNLANDDYKKVLMATGQEKNTSFDLLKKYEVSWENFYTKYKNNPINDFSNDGNFSNELNYINSRIIAANEKINKGEIHNAHLIKNNVSMLGTYLTDFHDKMEIAIDLNENNFNKNSLTGQCNILDISLNNIKNSNVDLGSDYNDKLNVLSVNLDNLCKFDNYNSYKDNGANLKKSFISLYLKYG